MEDNLTRDEYVSRVGKRLAIQEIFSKHCGRYRVEIIITALVSAEYGLAARVLQQSVRSTASCSVPETRDFVPN